MKLLKLLSLTALLVLALAAAAAPAASAAKFDAAAFPATIAGKQEGSHVFKGEGGFSVTCKSATLSGELGEPSATVTLTPTYAECTSLGVAATVKAEGCAYTLHASSQTGESSFDGTLDFACPAGKAITITTFTCEVQVGSQSGLSKVSYEDHPGAEPENVTMALSLVEITYNVIKDGFLCPFSGTGVKKGGSYTGTSLLTGSVAAVGVDIGVVPDAKTKLCKKMPAPLCEEAYGATNVEAVAKVPDQALTRFFVIKKPDTVENLIECKESKFTGKTKAAEGDPLDLEEATATFGDCETVLGTKCTTMQMTKVNGALVASAMQAGSGVLRYPVTLKVTCGKEIVCEYEQPLYKLVLVGGNPAGLTAPGSSIPINNKGGVAGEAGCFDFVQWFASYLVSTPKPVWLAN